VVRGDGKLIELRGNKRSKRPRRLGGYLIERKTYIGKTPGKENISTTPGWR